MKHKSMLHIGTALALTLSVGGASLAISAAETDFETLLQNLPTVESAVAGADEAQQLMLGDPSGNGVIDTEDALMALRAYVLTLLGQEPELDDLQFRAADITADGVMAAEDASYILAYYVNSFMGGADWCTLLGEVALPSDGDTLTVIGWEEYGITSMLEYWTAQTGKPTEFVKIADAGMEMDESLAEYLLGGNDADIIALEQDWAPHHFSSFAPLEQVGITKQECEGLYSYAMQSCYDADGAMKMLPVECCPGGYMYRADLAETYLGVKSPEEMQVLVQDWDAFAETACALYEASAGETLLAASLGGIYQAAEYSIPWADSADGSPLVTDAHRNLAEYLRALCGIAYDPAIGQWTGEWNTVVYENKALGYFVPNWGFNVFAWPELPDGVEWDVCQGPTPYYWGGLYMGVNLNTDNAEECSSFFNTTLLQTDTAADYMVQLNETYPYMSPNAAATRKAIEAGAGVVALLGTEDSYGVLAENGEKMRLPADAVYNDDYTYEFRVQLSDYVSSGSTMTLDEMLAAYLEEAEKLS